MRRHYLQNLFLMLKNKISAKFRIFFSSSINQTLLSFIAPPLILLFDDKNLFFYDFLFYDFHCSSTFVLRDCWWFFFVESQNDAFFFRVYLNLLSCNKFLNKLENLKILMILVKQICSFPSSLIDNETIESDEENIEIFEKNEKNEKIDQKIKKNKNKNKKINFKELIENNNIDNDNFMVFDEVMIDLIETKIDNKNWIETVWNENLLDQQIYQENLFEILKLSSKKISTHIFKTHLKNIVHHLRNIDPFLFKNYFLNLFFLSKKEKKKTPKKKKKNTSSTNFTLKNVFQTQKMKIYTNFFLWLINLYFLFFYRKKKLIIT